MAPMRMIVRMLTVRVSEAVIMMMIAVLGMGAHLLYCTRPHGASQPSPALIGQFDTLPPRID